jgi:hypothetical protein
MSTPVSGLLAGLRGERLCGERLCGEGQQGEGPLPDVGLHSAELELAADPLNLLAGSPAKWITDTTSARGAGSPEPSSL